jgi:hypothetical protein
VGILTSTEVSRQGFDLLQFRGILLGGNDICRKGVYFADAGRSFDTSSRAYFLRSFSLEEFINSCMLCGTSN